MAGLTFDDIPAAAVPGTKKGLTFDDVPAAAPPASPDSPGFWGTVGDMAASVPTGAIKGIAETIMSPATLARMSKQSEDQAKAFREKQPGYDANSWTERPLSELLGLGEDPLGGVRDAIFGGQDTVRKTMDENLYQPKTALGRGTEELASFLAPAAWPSRVTRLATGGARVGNYLADLLAHGVAPWAGYETGKAVGGPELGAVLAFGTGLGGGAVRAAHSPELMLKRAMEGNSAADIARANTLEQTGQNIGVDLSPAESIAQATNQPGHPILKALRMAEASPSGATVTGPAFEPRAGQIDNAVRDVLDQALGLPPINPQTVGPQVAEAASGVMREAENARTGATRPFYQQANPQTVDRGGMDQMLAEIDQAIAGERSGLASPALEQLRETLIAQQAQPAVPPRPTGVLDANGQPVMDQGTPAQPAVPHLDVNTLDTIKKEFQSRIDAREPGVEAIPSYARGLVTPFLERLNQMMEAASNAYVQGKDTHGLMSRAVVAPVEHGPIGDLARAPDTQAAGNVLLPRQPQANMTNAVVDAVQRIGQRTAALPGLLRQQIDQIFSDVGKATRGGNRQYAGSELEKALRGRPETAARLNALAQQLGQPGSVQQIGDLLDVLQATGMRLAEGSPTAAANTMYGDLSSGLPAAAGEAVLNRGQGVGSALAGMMRDATLRANVRRVGELLRPRADGLRNLMAEIERTGLQAVGAGGVRSGVAALYNYLNEPGKEPPK